MATFNEKRTPTFEKYVAEQDVNMANLLQSLHILVALLRFCFRKVAWKFKF